MVAWCDIWSEGLTIGRLWLDFRPYNFHVITLGKLFTHCASVIMIKHYNLVLAKGR